MANIEDLRDRSVSSGTLKSEDLIPKFLGVLKTYGKDKYDKYIKENPEVEDWEDLDDETMGWVVDELTDLLNEIAPEGCFFGASEGDGADFGFWSMSNESKKSEADGNKDIFILDLTRIYADGDEEGLDDMQAAQDFYDEDEAIQAAKELADSYKDDDDVVLVTVMAGEQEKPNGDIVGEPFDIFTASSSDSATTAKYREKAGYTKTDGLDYYAKGGTSESKKSEKATVICSICGNPTDDPIWGEGNRAFCKDCYGDGDDFKHGKTKFVVGMMISLDGVKQYIRELKPRTFVGQSVDTGKEFSLPISSLNRASILYDPRNESKKSEAYNWIAFYFCKDKRTGTEYAVIPQDRVFVVGNGGGRYNLSYLDANGHWDRLSYGYFATSCEPISDPENSKVYATVKADEDRRIIALTESEFDTIVEADDAVKTVKSIVANNYESKKSESLTLKQKELKDMARFGQAEDITTISDEEAKALRKKGIETIGVSRGTYGMNGALLRDNEGKKYVITARSSNLFYFV